MYDFRFAYNIYLIARVLSVKRSAWCFPGEWDILSWLYATF